MDGPSIFISREFRPLAHMKIHLNRWNPIKFPPKSSNSPQFQTGLERTDVEPFEWLCCVYDDGFPGAPALQDMEGNGTYGLKFQDLKENTSKISESRWCWNPTCKTFPQHVFCNHSELISFVFSPNSFRYRGSYFKYRGEGSQILWIRFGGAVGQGVVWCVYGSKNHVPSSFCYPCKKKLAVQ